MYPPDVNISPALVQSSPETSYFVGCYIYVIDIYFSLTSFVVAICVELAYKANGMN
jgi:hypothetical protein